MSMLYCHMYLYIWSNTSVEAHSLFVLHCGRLHAVYVCIVYLYLYSTHTHMYLPILIFGLKSEPTEIRASQALGASDESGMGQYTGFPRCGLEPASCSRFMDSAAIHNLQKIYTRRHSAFDVKNT